MLPTLLRFIEKILIISWSFLALYIFAPDYIKSQFNNINFLQNKENEMLLGFYLVSSVIISLGFFNLINILKQKREDKLVKKYLLQLDITEKAILREFFIQRLFAIKLPKKDSAVILLAKNQVIQKVTEKRYYRSQIYNYYCLNPIAKKELTISKLNMPINENKEDFVQSLKNSRPSFVVDYLKDQHKEKIKRIRAKREKEKLEI